MIVNLALIVIGSMVVVPHTREPTYEVTTEFYEKLSNNSFVNTYVICSMACFWKLFTKHEYIRGETKLLHATIIPCILNPATSVIDRVFYRCDDL